MDDLSNIRKPIISELEAFNNLFQEALTHSDGLLASAL